MTDLARVESALAGAPTDANGIIELVQGVMVHPFLVGLYGIELSAERSDDVQTRSAADIVERMLDIDPRPLTYGREPDMRFAGNCRHFSVLTVALLRRAGVPCRARCGFGGYFEAGRWVDHWVVERWDDDRWVMLDAQIDVRQRAAMHIDFDTTDMPPGMFLNAAEAWQHCRSGDEDGQRFGILDMWGEWFIAGNVGRDFAALNKVEMLPWDGWGDLSSEGKPPGGDAEVDDVAAVVVRDDFDEVRQRYDSDAGLRVPTRVVAFATPTGPREVEVSDVI